MLADPPNTAPSAQKSRRRPRAMGRAAHAGLIRGLPPPMGQGSRIPGVTNICARYMPWTCA